MYNTLAPLNLEKKPTLKKYVQHLCNVMLMYYLAWTRSLMPHYSASVIEMTSLMSCWAGVNFSSSLQL